MNALTPATADTLLGSTALSTPTPAVPDAALIAASAEYAGLLADFEATDMDARPGTRRAKLAQTAQEKVLAAIDGVVDRMVAMVATTPAGLLARTYALGRHDPAFVCAYDSADDSVGAKLLGPLLRDAAALATRAPTPESDTVLIAHCRAYVEAVVVYNANPSDIGDEDDPASKSMSEAEDAAAEIQATTLAGVVAKAQVATFLAQQPDGSLNYSDSITGDWPAQVVQDLLAMSGSAPPQPPPGADAEILVLAAEFHRLHAQHGDQGDETWDGAGKAKWGCFDKLADMVPASQAGHRAKAEVAVAMLAELHEGDAGCPAAAFAKRTLRGWLGQGASA